MKYRYVAIEGQSVNPSPGVWKLDDTVASVKAAVDAGDVPYVKLMWAPAHWTTTNEPAYMPYERGCSSLRFQSVLRIHITDADPKSPLEPPGTAANATTPVPDRATDRARVATFYCKRGAKIRVGAPGAMWRSPSGFLAGLPGGEHVQHGQLTRSDSDTRPGVNVDGGFCYTNDGTGDLEEVRFNLIDPVTFQQPYGALPYFDTNTFSYCAFGKTPGMYPPVMFEAGYRIATALAPFADKIAFWQCWNEPEYRTFYPCRLKNDEDNSPDLARLQREIIAPFAAGVRSVNPNANFSGPETGSPDILQWWLALAGGKDAAAATLHVYAWSGESFPAVIGDKLDQWFRPLFDRAGWNGPVILTELGDLSASDGSGNIGQDSMNAAKVAAVWPLLQARPWVTAAFRSDTGLVEAIEPGRDRVVGRP